MNKGMHESNSVSVFINVFGDGYWDFLFLFFILWKWIIGIFGSLPCWNLVA